MTSSFHIVGIGGTLRPRSASRFALEHSLRAAEAAGATTELIDLNQYRLPMYEPDLKLEDYSSGVTELLDAVRRSDALIISTGAYHGTVAGVTKNALDFIQFLASEPRPYFDGRIVGLISTAAGDLAAVNAINAMVHAVHALRGMVAPLFVPMPRSWEMFDESGQVLDSHWGGRLELLGQLVLRTGRALKTCTDPLNVSTE